MSARRSVCFFRANFSHRLVEPPPSIPTTSVIVQHQPHPLHHHQYNHNTQCHRLAHSSAAAAAATEHDTPTTTTTTTATEYGTSTQATELNDTTRTTTTATELGYNSNPNHDEILASTTQAANAAPAPPVCPVHHAPAPSPTAPDLRKTHTAPRPLRDMPGPRGVRDLPVVGLFLQFQPFTKYTVATFSNLINAHHAEFGDIFKIRTGTKHMVISSNVNDAQTMFRTEGPYPRRRLLALSKIYRERNNMPMIMGSLEGAAWWRLRSPLNILLNRPQVSLQYLPAQNLVADDFADALSKQDLSATDTTDIILRYAAESAGVVCFNQRLGMLGEGAKGQTKLLEAYQTLMSSNHRAMIGLEWKYRLTERDAFYQRYSAAMRLVESEATKYVQNVRDALAVRGARNDVVDYTDLEHNLLAHLITRSKLELKEIIAIIESIMVVGSDSTAKNLAVALYNLATHPRAQARLVSELRSVLGPRGPLTPDALTRLPYLKACVKESMRLHFPISNGTLRELPADTVLSGYTVPAGTSVILNIRRMARDPRFYHRPHSYIPERWLRPDRRNHSNMNNNSNNKKTNHSNGINGTIDTHNSGNNVRSTTSTVASEHQVGSMNSEVISEGHPTDENIDYDALYAITPPAFSYLPFGHGARSCVGRRFAEMEMHVGVAKILQKLHVSVDPTYRGIQPVTYTPFITPREDIPLRFTPRDDL